MGANKKQMLNTEDHQLGIPCHLAHNILYAIREAEKRGTLLVFECTCFFFFEDKVLNHILVVLQWVYRQ